MEKIITIMDYSNQKKDIEIRDFEDVVKIWVDVITGDEILNVLYKNYNIEKFDSCNYRMQDYFDASYCIYNTTDKIDKLEQWNKRKDSYDYGNEYNIYIETKEVF